MKFTAAFPQISISQANFLRLVSTHSCVLLLIPVLSQAAPPPTLPCLAAMNFKIASGPSANSNFYPFFGAFILFLINMTLLTAPSHAVYSQLTSSQSQI